jgi:hypothetical protein
VGHQRARRQFQNGAEHASDTVRRVHAHFVKAARDLWDAELARNPQIIKTELATMIAYALAAALVYATARAIDPDMQDYAAHRLWLDLELKRFNHFARRYLAGRHHRVHFEPSNGELAELRKTLGKLYGMVKDMEARDRTEIC